MKQLRPRDPWAVAALLCLFGGAVLLVVAWYDVSGTANVYEQLPYLVSAGFTGLALIIVGSGLLAAGRADRVERRLAQLLDALTEAATAGSSPSASPQVGGADPSEVGAAGPGPSNGSATLLAVAGSETFHRPGCLLLHDKTAEPVSPDDIAERGLTPCPVCEPVL